MRPPNIMLVAGDPSGDANAADLVRALAAAAPEAVFFGLGGPSMAAAGVELNFDLTASSVIGMGGLIAKFPLLLGLLYEMVFLAADRRAEMIILVDYGGFNLLLARLLRLSARAGLGGPGAWRPKIVQFISPQVWASRPGRARALERNYDLLISIIPFEKEWYASRAPRLPVEFVGNPIFDRFLAPVPRQAEAASGPLVLLLPGSRRDELKRHLPVMLAAAQEIRAQQTVEFLIVVPTERLAEIARHYMAEARLNFKLQTGKLAEALASATLAITKTGTVTLECAFFGVPAVALYKTSFTTYFIGRRLVNVKYIAMPNLLAGEALFPEFIQDEATSKNLAAAALQLLTDPTHRQEIRVKLARITEALGSPGAARRAAAALISLLHAPSQRAKDPAS